MSESNEQTTDTQAELETHLGALLITNRELAGAISEAWWHLLSYLRSPEGVNADWRIKRAEEMLLATGAARYPKILSASEGDVPESGEYCYLNTEGTLSPFHYDEHGGAE